MLTLILLSCSVDEPRSRPTCPEPAGPGAELSGEVCPDVAYACEE